MVFCVETWPNLSVAFADIEFSPSFTFVDSIAMVDTTEHPVAFGSIVFLKVPLVSISMSFIPTQKPVQEDI